MKLTAVHFDYNTNAVSQKAFDEHIQLYNGYVAKYNETTEGLAKVALGDNPTFSAYRGLKLGQAYSLAGVVLHEIYFGCMSSRPSAPCALTTQFLETGFGSYQGWMDDFKACAASARGWAVLCYEPRSISLSNIMLDTHDDGMIAGTYPLTAIDMYEHSYFGDYGTNRKQYIENFTSSINWLEVSGRIKTVAQIVASQNASA